MVRESYMKFIIFLILNLICLSGFTSEIPKEVSDRLKSEKPKYITEYRRTTFYADIVKSLSRKENFFDLILKKSKQVIPGTAVYLTKKTLLDTDSIYDLKSPWMLNAPLENGQHLTMETMIILNGTVIFGYPKESKVKVENYRFLTNKYKYSKTIILRLNGTTYLHEPPLSGPLGVDIDGYSYSGGKLEMLYGIMFMQFSRVIEALPIEARKLQSKSPFSRSSFY